MNGILIIDKPEGITSHDVVARCRRILKTKRIGHTGTLDPFATGVVAILVGQATRLAQFLDKDAKEYEARVRFGFETTTGDLTGEAKGIQNSKFKIQNSEIVKVFDLFRGEILQTPPMYSAKKVEGKKLYELARKGIEIERKEVPVTIYELEMIDEPHGAELAEEAAASGKYVDNERNEINIRVRCSAGTYIRTLAEDIGKSLGVGAHLTGLRRNGAGKFMLAEALTLEQLEVLTAEDGLSGMLISMSDALSHLPAINLSEEDLARVRNGMKVTGVPDGADIFRLVAPGGELAAIGARAGSNLVQPKIVLV